MPTTWAVGYMVVRLPEWNYDVSGRGVYRRTPPQLDGLRYEGIDRMSWFDIDEDYYIGALPKNLFDVREQIKNENRDLTGMLLTQQFEVAKRLLDYSNRTELRNEIIAVRSHKLAQIKGEVVIPEEKLRWIGYDIVDLGHWSLIAEGIFVAPDSFPSWRGLLNGHGLMADCSLVSELIDSYTGAAENDKVEQLAPSVYGIDTVEIARMVYSA
jgi:hypothetical protein